MSTIETKMSTIGHGNMGLLAVNQLWQYIDYGKLLTLELFKDSSSGH